MNTESTYHVCDLRKAQGLSCVYGHVSALEASQQYPLAYGTNVARAWASWRDRNKKLVVHVQDSDSESDVDLYDKISTDPWLDAGMSRVAKDLCLPLDRLIVPR